MANNTRQTPNVNDDIEQPQTVNIATNPGGKFLYFCNCIFNKLLAHFN